MRQEKRYQELGALYRIVLWLRWMPIGYIRAFGWYFIKRLRWEDVCDDDEGRVSLSTCIGICIGMSQYNMRWCYTIEEVFDNGCTTYRDDEKSYIERMFDFLGSKLIEIVDGKTIYD